MRVAIEMNTVSLPTRACIVVSIPAKAAMGETGIDPPVSPGCHVDGSNYMYYVNPIHHAVPDGYGDYSVYPVDNVISDQSRGAARSPKEEEKMKTSTVTIKVEGAFPYTESIQVPDERIASCLREVRETLERHGASSRARRKAATVEGEAPAEETAGDEA